MCADLGMIAIEAQEQGRLETGKPDHGKGLDAQLGLHTLYNEETGRL